MRSVRAGWRRPRSPRRPPITEAEPLRVYPQSQRSAERHTHCDTAAVSNVSLLHEAPLEVLRQEPRAVLTLLQLAVPDAAVQRDVTVELLDSELTEAKPSVARADLVVLVRDDSGRAELVIVVEVQRERDDEKLFAWPLYMAYLHHQHRIPVTLLVLVFDESVAAWARKSRQTGSNMVFAPWVVGPGELPEIESVEQALAHPELGMLTALARLGARDATTLAKHEADVTRVFEGLLLAKESRVRSIYLSLLQGVATGALRSRLDKLLEANGMGTALEIIFNDGKAAGEASGEARGEARALLKILRQRGLEVDAAAELRIRETRELELLDRWLERALEARTVEEIFAA